MGEYAGRTSMYAFRTSPQASTMRVRAEYAPRTHSVGLHILWASDGPFLLGFDALVLLVHMKASVWTKRMVEL